MTSKSTTGTKQIISMTPTAKPAGAGPEADFSDTIAHNRGLKLLALDALPLVPSGFRSTDPEVRSRRLRRLAGDLRSEAMDALREGGSRDLQAELGRFAPDPQRAVALADRLSHSGQMVSRAEALLAYAKEVDQIGMSDALVFLEAEQKQYLNAVSHDAGLAASYRALVRLFDLRSGAIAEGMARARNAEGATPAPATPTAPKS